MCGYEQTSAYGRTRVTLCQCDDGGGGGDDDEADVEDATTLTSGGSRRGAEGDGRCEHDWRLSASSSLVGGLQSVHSVQQNYKVCCFACLASCYSQVDVTAGVIVVFSNANRGTTKPNPTLRGA